MASSDYTRAERDDEEEKKEKRDVISLDLSHFVHVLYN